MERKRFNIEQEHNDIVYEAFVEYWSKDFKIVLTSPENKLIDSSHMPYMAPSRFARKGETTERFIDIEEIAYNCLSSYILKLK